MKNLYLIPGLGESSRSKNYRKIIKMSKKAGFKIVRVNIDWAMDMDITDFIEQTDKLIPDEPENSYILGFSFGSYIATILSKKKKVDGFIFCSTSPYFKDDLKYIPKKAKKYLGPKMMNSFKKYSFPKNIKTRAWFLIGEKDWPLAIKRNRKSYNLWKGPKKIKIIKEARHELNHENYTKEIENIMKKL